MKKLLLLFVFITVCLGTLHSQEKVYHVQGQPRPDISISTLSKENKSPTLRSNDGFTFDDVKFWVGEGENKALLVIDWYLDGSQTLVWGYKWDGTAYGIDMVLAIAAADPRFTFLTHATGPMGNTIAGFGYDVDGEGSQCLYYDGDTDNPICPENGTVTTNAYNYDSWTTSDPADYWRSGWYEGYWSYQVKDNLEDDFAYSGLGASSRELQNGSVDGWGYQDGWESWEGTLPKAPFVAALPPPTPVSGISLDKETLTMETGDSFTLTATISPEDATNKELIWSSSNPEIVGVSESGTISAISVGETTITATTVDGDYSASCVITVNRKIIYVESINISPSILTLEEEETFRFGVTILPYNSDNQNITWSSSDPSVAIVNEYGTIHAIQGGTTEVRATTEDGGHTSISYVTVIGKIPFEIELSNDSEITLNFTKVEKANSYNVYLYSLKDDEPGLESSYVLDENGNITEQMKSQNGSSNQLSVTLTRKDIKFDYLVKIEAVQHKDNKDIVIATMETQLSNAVSNETVNLITPSAYYKDGNLIIRNMDGYTACVISLDGRIVNAIQVAGDDYSHKINLSSGIYVLSGTKQGEKNTFKFVVQ
ncbi:Ig-like domain-containing protein [Massilibacteroides sp.]|uniref:Ig-like domain-containing protein n=1 Tax=Massilibacteroides sp. TaxID=2034766 RepID=UPI0026131C89|nr:Ig-like domain-containing protein [Massilibacteroides sp.]MDD4514362.1 Ig-like domain-containing protein [Massilibacteroides sp.]